MKICCCLHVGYAILLSLVILSNVAGATIIHVPADKPTIQAGINAASDGDTVLVSPGTYNEDISFLGKAIAVASSGGSAVTIINGTATGPVVKFVSGETSGAVLKGFTIENGNANTDPPYDGGGILIQSSSPIVRDNLITKNQADNGGGIAVLGGSPQILDNRIMSNFQNPAVDLGYGGGGMLVNGGSSLTITGNSFIHNSTTASGGGLALYSVTGGAIVMNNIFSGNIADYGDGGGVWNNSRSIQLIQNVMVGNSGRFGGGLFQFSNDLVAVNNTFGANTAEDGSAVYIFGPDAGVRFFNNLLIGATGFDAVNCDADGGSTFTNNDAYEPGSNGFAGTCANQSGVNANISVDPDFISKSNYRLKDGSPAIDTGDNSAPHLPATDFARNPRIINGNDGPTAIVDMGAYEFVPVTLTPKSLSFGSQPAGSTTTKTVTLTNNQTKPLVISSKSVPSGYGVSGCGTSVAPFGSCLLTVTFHPLTPGLFKGDMTVKDKAGNGPQTVGLSGRAQ